MAETESPAGGSLDALVGEAAIGTERLPRPGSVAAWLKACRTFSLTASITPVMIGTALALRAGFFSPARSSLALLGAAAIHLGTNLINDYYDDLKGADSVNSFGGSKVIQLGLLSAEQVWWGAVVSFGAGCLLGVALTYFCGWPILTLGILSVAAGYFYTAPPLSLGYNALGELTVFIFMGPVIVLGAYYVAALHFAWPPLIASLPIAFLVAAILHANNIRDLETDLAHRKLTLASLLGRRLASVEMIMLYGGAYVVILVGVFMRMLPWTVLATLLTVATARKNLRIVLTARTPEKLDLAVLGSAKLHFAFGLIFVAALLLSRAFGR